MAWFKAVDVGTLLDGAKAEADANMAEKRNAQNFILVYQSRCYVCTGTRDLCMLVSFVAENLVSCYGDEGCPIASTSQHQLRSKKAQMRTHVYSKRDIFVRVFSGDDRPRGDC